MTMVSPQIAAPPIAKKSRAKKGEGEAWAKREAKRVLARDIISGKVKKDMKPKEVQASRDVFSKFAPANFGTNLRNLREALARDHTRMLMDCQYYRHDAAVLIDHRIKYPHLELPRHLLMLSLSWKKM